MAIGCPLPAKRKYLVPKGLKRVRAKLADGTVRVYWYHRATDTRLKHDPETAEGLLEVKRLDDKAAADKTALEARTGSYAALWEAYTAKDSPEWCNLKPRTRSDYQKVRDWLGKAADKPVNTLTPQAVLALRDKAFRQKKRRFANYVVQVLSLTLNWGIPRGLCATNTAAEIASISRPKTARNVNRPWTMAEVEAFGAAAPRQLLVPWMLGLWAGMSEGDAISVTWSGYNGFELGWHRGKTGVESAAPVSGPFKTLLDDARHKRGLAVQIAVNAYGQPWTESGFRASFFKLIRKLVAAGAMQEGCTFHGLRHTIATIARDDGQSDFRVAAAIGDTSTAMAAIYGRDADRMTAQSEVLTTVQKRLGNIDWKTRLENGHAKPRRKRAKVLK